MVHNKVHVNNHLFDMIFENVKIYNEMGIIYIYIYK